MLFGESQTGSALPARKSAVVWITVEARSEADFSHDKPGVLRPPQLHQAFPELRQRRAPVVAGTSTGGGGGVGGRAPGGGGGCVDNARVGRGLTGVSSDGESGESDRRRFAVRLALAGMRSIPRSLLATVDVSGCL